MEEMDIQGLTSHKSLFPISVATSCTNSQIPRGYLSLDGKRSDV